MGKPTDVTKETFETAIAKGTVVVDFWAAWCGPCRMVAPVLEEIAAERSDITVVKVNVDEQPDLGARFSVRSIPTLIAFKDGREWKRIVGYQPKERLLAQLA